MRHKAAPTACCLALAPPPWLQFWTESREGTHPLAPRGCLLLGRAGCFRRTLSHRNTECSCPFPILPRYLPRHFLDACLSLLVTWLPASRSLRRPQYHTASLFVARCPRASTEPATDSGAKGPACCSATMTSSLLGAATLGGGACGMRPPSHCQTRQGSEGQKKGLGAAPSLISEDQDGPDPQRPSHCACAFVFYWRFCISVGCFVVLIGFGPHSTPSSRFRCSPPVGFARRPHRCRGRFRKGLIIISTADNPGRRRQLPIHGRYLDRCLTRTFGLACLDSRLFLETSHGLPDPDPENSVLQRHARTTPTTAAGLSTVAGSVQYLRQAMHCCHESRPQKSEAMSLQRSRLCTTNSVKEP